MLPKDVYEKVEKFALELFERGTELCTNNGLILVDTKYEFGMMGSEIILMDEIHTPDSSRFWINEGYKEKFEKG
ncbi:MAG: phosphoribosylaminoimidazolesuccinocarboxamide synthase, partial [Gammaproteobacteria bacterium]|nr:phosphoribosylaminoimidazolesuccinocarboxamide synthase [Gammaproteobacteria bacterium]